MRSIMKTVLPVLAVTGSAFAACSVSGTTTIQNAGDATAMASCKTFTGNIAIATDTSDDLSFDGMERLNGDLIGVEAPNVKRISANKLNQIDGEMYLMGLTRLYTLEFPSLKSVGSLRWNALPVLNTLGFTAEVTQAKSIYIENTALRSLDGINLAEAETVFIANNGFITSVDMDLGNVTNALTFANNNEALAINLPNLTWASNLTFRFVGSLEMPLLKTLNGSLGLYNNGFLNFSAPSLTKVGDALAIVANEQLNNLTFPLLTTVSANIQIANNSKIEKIDGFSALKRVGSAFDMSGNFTEVSTPQLNDVRGTFNIQSSENITESCNFYKNLKSKKLIAGSYKCDGTLSNPGMQGTSGGTSTADKKGAATTLSAVNGALGLAAMAAVFLF